MIMWAIFEENVEQPRFSHFPRNSEVSEDLSNFHIKISNMSDT